MDRRQWTLCASNARAFGPRPCGVSIQRLQRGSVLLLLYYYYYYYHNYIIILFLLLYAYTNVVVPYARNVLLMSGVKDECQHAATYAFFYLYICTRRARIEQNNMTSLGFIHKLRSAR